MPSAFFSIRNFVIFAGRSVLILMVLLATAAAGTFPPVPSGYQDLFTSLNTQISSFSTTVNASWNKVPYPVLYAPHVNTVSSSMGPELLGPNILAQALTEIQELQALGAKCVVLEISFPVLYRGFYSTDTEYQQYLNFYLQVASAIRAGGMKLVVETQSVVPLPGMTNFNPISYYNSLTWPQYEAGRAETALVIAQSLKPDYLSILTEPDTEAAKSGFSELNTVSGATELVNVILAALKQNNVQGVSVGAGVGSWLAAYPSFVASLASTAVNYIDVHVYNVNQTYLTNALAIADMAHAAGKQVAMTECWLSKVRDAELGGVLSSTDIVGRNPFSFWMPVDISFLQAMVNFSQYKQLLFMGPFWTQYYFGNLDYNAVGTLSSEEVLAEEEDTALLANAQGQFTPTGLAWEQTTVNGTDTTPPTVPATLSAKAGYGTISLSWTASTDNVGVAGYRIHRDGALLASTSSPSYKDWALPADTTHTYSVVAFDARGNQSPAATGSATTLYTKDMTPPSTPANFKAKGVSSHQINLSWSASTDNVAVAGYMIYRGTSSTNLSVYASATTTTYADTSATLALPYYYAVAAYDTSNNYSPRSVIVSASALADTTPPTVPTGVKAQPVSITQVNLSWSPSTDDTAVILYKLYRGTTATSLSQIGCVAAPATAFSDVHGVPGTLYYYAVSAVDSAGNASALSAAVTATTLADTTPPTVPGGLSATPVSMSQVNLSWSASTDDYILAYYKIFRGTSATNLLLIGGSTSTSYSDTHALPGTTYYYAVAACDVSGNVSAQSARVTITTVADTTPPSVPANVVATAVPINAVNLSWRASTDNFRVSRYKIFRGTSSSNLQLIGVSTTLSYSDSTAKALKQYYYTIAAVDVSGNVSPQSNVVSVTTL